MEPGAVVVTPGGSDVPEKVEYGTCIWTTGIKMHPLTQQIMATLPGGVLVPWWRICKALWKASRRCRRLPGFGTTLQRGQAWALPCSGCQEGGQVCANALQPGAL